MAPGTGGGGSSDAAGGGTTAEPASVLSASFDRISSSQADLSVELSRAAPVAAACVSEDDPSEVHLLEESGASSVQFRFAGLLAATTWDCSVATTAPPGEPMKISFTTLDLPDGTATADPWADPAFTRTGAYTLMTVKPACNGEEQKDYLLILDPEGQPRWRYDLPDGMNVGVEALPDGPDRFLWGGGDDHVGAPAVVDLFDGEQWKLSFSGSDDVIWHHDARRIADGRVLSVEQTDDDGWLAFQLRLVDDAGATSWLWDVRDAVATGWLPAGNAEETDPHHLNWADVVDAGDGPVAYGSLCYSFLIVAIDVGTSQPLWKFGAGGDFSLQDEQGRALPDDEFPQCQHGLQMDGTNLLVYDNGLNRGYTRSVEYHLDTSTMTATKTWEWQDDPPYWEMYHGGMDWLTPDHQRVLVAEGNTDCGTYSDHHSQVVEVDRPTGAPVHRLVLHDLGDWLYRAHRLDGCAIFANGKYCSAVADRMEELRVTLGL